MMYLSGRVKYILKLLFSLLLLGSLALLVDFNKAINILLVVPAWYFVVAVFLFAFYQIIATARWSVLMRNADFSHLLRVTFATQHLVFLVPSGATTDLVRIYTAKTSPGGLGLNLASVIIDKVSGFAVVLCLFSLSILNVENIGSDSRYAMVVSIFLLLIGLLTLGALYTKLPINLIEWIASRLEPIFPVSLQKHGETISQLKTGLAEVLGRTHSLSTSIGLAIVYQIAAALGYLLIANVLNFELQLWEAIWISTTLQVIMIVPLSFGGIGLKDVSFVSMMVILGVNTETALAASVAGYPVLVLFALLGWFLSNTNRRKYD